jgi:hypothetical protein
MQHNSQSIQKEENLNVSANVKQLDRIGARLISGVVQIELISL